MHLQLGEVQQAYDLLRLPPRSLPESPQNLSGSKVR